MKIKPSGRAAGFTLTEVMIVVGIVGILAEIAIPNFLEARKAARTSACMNNLRQIYNAKQQWALEELRAPTAVPTFEDIAVFMGYGGEPLANLYCPADQTKTYENSYDTLNLLETPECKVERSHILP